MSREQRILSEYLQPTGNVFPGHVVDTLGRALLPLDVVAFNYPTDQGLIVVMSGTVRRIVADIVLIEPHEFFVQNFGVMPELLVSPEFCLRLPNDPYSRSVVSNFFAQKNMMLAYQNQLTINGNKIKAAG